MATAGPFVIFCDGACSGNPGPGGWGAIVAGADEAWELGGGAGSTTNNRMELTAAIEALKSIAASPGKVTVHTDSVYVIRGITEWIWGWRKRGWKSATGGDVANRELWEELSRVVQPKGKDVTWQFVRGHTGNPGNERVDEIAVAYSQGIRPSLYRGPRATYLVPLHSDGESLPTRKPAAKSGKVYSYLSLLGGTPMRHGSWSECERRVKGQPNAKFRKAMSAEEERDILNSWGVRLP